MATTRPMHRVVLMKVKDEKDIPRMVEAAREMSAKAVKDGKLYIHDLKAGPAQKDERSKGFNYVMSATFESAEHNKFYDEECESHNEFKDFIADLVTEKLPAWFEDDIGGSFMKLTPKE